MQPCRKAKLFTTHELVETDLGREHGKGGDVGELAGDACPAQLQKHASAIAARPTVDYEDREALGVVPCGD